MTKIIKSLQSLRVAKNIFGYLEFFQKEWNKKKLSLNLLKIALPPSAHEAEIVQEISFAITEASSSEALAIYSACDRRLKAEILIPETEVNMELYHKLNLEATEISKAFLSKKLLDFPYESDYSKHYIDYFDTEVSEQLAQILQKLSVPEVEEILEHLGYKSLYLFVAMEINESGAEEEVECAFNVGDQVPLECPLLAVIQEKTPVIFKRLAQEIQNRDYPELREMFYELQRRNEATRSNSPDKKDYDYEEGSSFSNKILED